MGRCKCNEIQKKKKMAVRINGEARIGHSCKWKAGYLEAGFIFFFFFLGEWRGEQMKHGINVIYVEFYVNL